MYFFTAIFHKIILSKSINFKISEIVSVGATVIYLNLLKYILV